MNHRSPSGVRVQPLRERLRETAAELILDAAEQVFGEHGVDVRMEAIAARAGVAVGTLYNHFADRQALLDALLDARRAGLLERVRAVMAEREAEGFAVQLESVLGVFAGVSVQQARFRKALLDAGLRPAAKRRKVVRTEFGPLFAELFARGRKEGVLPDRPPALLAALMMGLLRASFEHALDHPDELPLERVAKTAADAFVHGVGKRVRS